MKDIKIKEVKIKQIIETQILVGEGTEKDPVRIVTQYWDLDGNLLATNKHPN